MREGSAGEQEAGVVILRLNTPGGLATSMREVIADVLGSSVPVIGYVVSRPQQSTLCISKGDDRISVYL